MSRRDCDSCCMSTVPETRCAWGSSELKGAEGQGERWRVANVSEGIDTGKAKQLKKGQAGRGKRNEDGWLHLTPYPYCPADLPYLTGPHTHTHSRSHTHTHTPAPKTRHDGFPRHFMPCRFFAFSLPLPCIFALQHKDALSPRTTTSRRPPYSSAYLQQRPQHPCLCRGPSVSIAYFRTGLVLSSPFDSLFVFPCPRRLASRCRFERDPGIWGCRWIASPASLVVDPHEDQSPAYERKRTGLPSLAIGHAPV